MKITGRINNVLAKGIRQANGLEVVAWNSLKKPDTELTLPAGLLVKVPANPRVHLQSPQVLADMHNTNLLVLGWTPPLSGALILGSFQR